MVMSTGDIQPVGIGGMTMRTETWVQIRGVRQYRLNDGYVTNCLMGMCKNPDAMCDALNGATVESGEYAISLNEVCGEHLESKVWFRSYERDLLNDLYTQIRGGNLKTTKEVLGYAEKQDKKLNIEKSDSWRREHNDWKGYGD